MLHIPKRLVLTTSLIITTIGTLVPLASGQPFDYALFELPVLDELDPSSWPQAINNHGEIVGGSYLSTGGRHAVLWDSTSYNIHDLGVIDGSYSLAKDINNLGDIVGDSNWLPNQSAFESHACLWRDGSMIDLGTFGGEESEAEAVNDLGQIVGFAYNSEEHLQPYLWEDGEMLALPGLDSIWGLAYDINNTSQVVGKATSGRSSVAVLWQDGEIFALPELEYGSSGAHAINDFGQIVGRSDKGSNVHAVAWVDGKVHDLHDNNAGKHSSAWGINNVGQVVGWVGTPPFNDWGFLWEKETGMRRLNDLVPPLLVKNWRLLIAYGINDLGQIAVTGAIQGSPLLGTRPFLMSPIYPSFDLSLAMPGIGGEINTITASNLEPGTKVYFVWGKHGGGTIIPGCSVQTNALQIENPKVTGSAVADVNGIAVLEGLVPSGISGQWLLFQGVVPGDCAISNLVVQKFE